MVEGSNSSDNQHSIINFDHGETQPQIDGKTPLSPSSTLQSPSTSHINLSDEIINQMMLEYLRGKGYDQEPTIIRLNNNRPNIDSSPL